MSKADLSIKIRVTSADLVYDKKLLRQVMRTAGAEVAATARQLIRSSPATGLRRGKTIASSPGNAPRSQTGQLARSIKVRSIGRGTGVSITSAGPARGGWYARALEVGAAHNAPAGTKRSHSKRVGAPPGGYRMLPRPFLSTALAQREGSLGPRIQEALRQSVKLVRVKP